MPYVGEIEAKIQELDDDTLFNNYVQTRAYEGHLIEKYGDAKFREITVTMERVLESRDLFPWGAVEPISRVMRNKRRGESLHGGLH